VNHDDIIRMAKNEFGIYAFTADDLAKFVELIASVERKACAHLVASQNRGGDAISEETRNAIKKCADFIRARTNQGG